MCLLRSVSLINTVKHGSALLPLLLHLSLCEAKGGGVFCNAVLESEPPKLAVNQAVALLSMDLWLRHLPVTDHFAF